MIRRVYIIGLLTLVLGCTTENNRKCIREGIIEYEIRFSEDISNRNTATNLLPKKMILTFDRHYAKTTISGFMGLFNMGLITDLRTRKSQTFVKIFDKKYVYQGEKNEPSVIFAHHPAMQLRYLDDTLVAAGFRSQRVITSYNGQEQVVEFTRDICIADANCNNPFTEIDGVLTGFFIVMNSYTLYFTATEFRNEKVKATEFELDNTFVPISRERMLKIIDELLP